MRLQRFVTKIINQHRHLTLLDYRMANLVYWISR